MCKTVGIPRALFGTCVKTLGMPRDMFSLRPTSRTPRISTWKNDTGSWRTDSISCVVATLVLWRCVVGGVVWGRVDVCNF